MAAKTKKKAPWLGELMNYARSQAQREVGFIEMLKSKDDVAHDERCSALKRYICAVYDQGPRN